MRVATQLARDRCRERIQRLSRSSLDCESVQRAVISDLQRVIGFDRWCLPHADPDTFLFWDAIHPTARVHELLADFVARAIGRRHGHD